MNKNQNMVFQDSQPQKGCFFIRHFRKSMHKIPLLLVLLFMCVLLYGCGETVSGMVKDTSRVGKGVNTVLFRQ